MSLADICYDRPRTRCEDCESFIPRSRADMSQAAEHVQASIRFFGGDPRLHTLYFYLDSCHHGFHLSRISPFYGIEPYGG